MFISERNKNSDIRKGFSKAPSGQEFNKNLHKNRLAHCALRNIFAREQNALA